MSGAQRRIDLSENAGFLLALIDSPLQWRSRLVEELMFEGAAHVQVTSSYEVDFAPDLIGSEVKLDVYERANLLLPLATRDKRTLLNLKITGPGGAPAHLLSRASTAALEAQYIDALIDTSDRCVRLRAGLPEALLEAICVFTPGYYREVLRGCGDDETLALLRYLSSGLGSDVELTSADVDRWRDWTRVSADLLANHARSLPTGISSSEELLLAVPRVDPLPRTVAEIEDLVKGFVDAVALANEIGDDLLLRTLAEYGRRDELIVEVEVPLLEPSTIKVSEDRPLSPSRGGWVTQTFPLGGARSAHMEARVADPNVVIDDKGGFEIRDLFGREMGFGPFESMRLTEESLALYSAEVERPEHVEVSIRLRPRDHVRSTAVVLMLLNIGAAVVAMAMPHDEVLVERLALLTIPTTLAATFVLVREQTALASRLLGRARTALGITTVVLWLVVLGLLMTFHPGRDRGSGRHSGTMNRQDAPSPGR